MWLRRLIVNSTLVEIAFTPGFYFFLWQKPFLFWLVLLSIMRNKTTTLFTCSSLRHRQMNCNWVHYTFKWNNILIAFIPCFIFIDVSSLRPLSHIFGKQILYHLWFILPALLITRTRPFFISLLPFFNFCTL